MGCVIKKFLKYYYVTWTLEVYMYLNFFFLGRTTISNLFFISDGNLHGVYGHDENQSWHKSQPQKEIQELSQKK